MEEEEPMSMRMNKAAIVGVVALALTLATTEARADGFVIPFIGINFGGDAGNSFDIDDVGDVNRASFGAAVGYMGGGIFGAELDIAYTRNFFGSGPGVEGNSLLTIMPALVLGIPIGGQHGGGVRPYGLAGIGMTRRNLSVNNLDVFDGSDIAYSFGGGVTVYFSDHVGVNAEYRYLRNFEVDEITLEELDDLDIDIDRGAFNFSRVSFGVAFRF
jgi:opacity protein-like surface antigen